MKRRANNTRTPRAACPNNTPLEHLEDEMILAKIIAGGMASGRKVAPHSGRGDRMLSGHFFGESKRGPCCAVGAGILFAGIRLVNSSAVKDFARAYGVTESYAGGVSNGFEYDWNYVGNADDVRGESVGDAAFDFFYENEPEDRPAERWRIRTQATK